MKSIAWRAGLVIAIVGLLAWMGSHMSFREVKIYVPLQGEAARNPFYAAMRMSEELGAEAAWERVFTAPRTDSVVFLSSWNWSLSRARRDQMERWVEAGGRLVVDSTVIGDQEEFERWSGVRRVDLEAQGEEESEEVDDDEEEAPEYLFDQLTGEPCRKFSEDATQRELDVCGVSESRALETSGKVLWALRDGENIHALRIAVGRGSVTVINASPFRYRSFLQGDHPALFVTMAQLHRGDAVLFLTEEDRASLLRLMWRFGAPAVLLLIAAVGLALWRAGQSFGPKVAPTQTARRSLAEQIRGTGRFALRFGGGKALHAATLRALRDAAIRRFPGYDQMSSEARVAAVAAGSGLSADELGPAMNFSGERSAHELRHAIALLESARRNLSTKQAGRHGN
ncbi:MAG TPA: DUF4350 domain-containing protein [Steroidobacteraceae bacterium]|nr:DUF4350 domain-containing protein [Steroidobacteraceae bacterium]